MVLFHCNRTLVFIAFIEMGVVKFCVIFDKFDRVYYPGEMVTGRVDLVINSIMKMRGVEMKIKGRAKCKWHEHQGRYTTTRKSTEVYIKSEQILIGGRDKFKLPPGQYSYPFAVMLPLKAPSSFSGSRGEISYYGKAKIDIPLAFDKKERTEFTVICPLNLDLLPNLRTPYKNEKTKTYGCLWCTSGSLAIAVRVPKTGFSKFESIPVTVEVDNASNNTINAIQVLLRRKICWTADGHQKIEDSKLERLCLGGVEAGKSRTWSENLSIPSNSFPNLNCCTIITMEHELKISTWGVKVHIPIVIADFVIFNDPEAPKVIPRMQMPTAGILSQYPNRNPLPNSGTSGDGDEYLNLWFEVPLMSDLHPSAQTVIPQMQTIPNMAYNPGMQIPTGGMISNHSNHNPNPNSGSGDGDEYFHQWFGVPSSSPLAGDVAPQLGMNNASPKLGFVEPNTHSNDAEIPQIPTQETSLPNQQYPPQAPLALPSLSPQPATNPDCSENSHHPSVANSGAGDGLALPSLKTDVQLENTSFLSASKGQNAENVNVAAPQLQSTTAQKNSAPVQEHPSQVTLALPSLPPKPTISHESSQNSPRPEVPDAGAFEGLKFPSFHSDVQLEKTSFLSDS